MLRWHVVSAIFWRNFKQYFTSVLGYLFIFVFVTVCAMLTFNEQFFADNLTNLDQLSKFFPSLLLFLIPAITMPVWAEERKQGTDSILFTLPASDLEILIGKYKAVVMVYTVALVFSATTLLALSQLGNPDWGVIGTTYLGYWLAGIMMLAIGMFASSLTNSSTVAFVLGAVFCAIPVLIGKLLEGSLQTVTIEKVNQVWRWIKSGFSDWDSTPIEYSAPVDYLQAYGVGNQLQDFTNGLISFPGVVYFLSIAAFMLYLNLVVVGKRHWNRGKQGSIFTRYAMRIVALLICLVSINVIADRSSLLFDNRIDLTAEKLFKLDPATIETLENAEANNRSIEISAYISKDVPRKYVSTKKNLIGLLRQYERLGRSNVTVRYVDMHPDNDVAIKDAISQGMKKETVRETIGGRLVQQDVYMGAVIKTPLDQVQIPFIDGDSSIEYALTRAISTATTKQSKLQIGILKTDNQFDNVQFEGREYAWSCNGIIEYMRERYDVQSITADDLPMLKPKTPVTDPNENESENADDDSKEETDSANDTKDIEKTVPDVLIVADPSSLTIVGVENLVRYIQAGNPVLILADPLPFYAPTYHRPQQMGIINAPAQERIAPNSRWQALTTSAQPKATQGKATSLMESLGINWKHDRVVWSMQNPHVGFKPVFPQQFGESWPENYGPRQNLFVFARSYADHTAFNPDTVVSSGLQDLMFVFPGSLSQSSKANSSLTFQPLVMLKPDAAGHLDWNEFTEDLELERTELNQRTGESRTVKGPVTNQFTGHNVRVIKKRPMLKQPASHSERRSLVDGYSHVLAARIKGTDENKTNVIFICDIDFVSDMFFQQRDAVDTPLDNVTFFVNALESLAGDESLARLRNRRPIPRTLTTIEMRKEPFKLQAAQKQEEAEFEASKKLEESRLESSEREKRIQADDELSLNEKAGQMIFNEINQSAQQKVAEEEIREELKKDLAEINRNERSQSTRIETEYRWLAIFAAGLPALFLGSIVLLYRTATEHRQISPERRVRKIKRD